MFIFFWHSPSFGFSAIFHARFDFVHLSGPFQAGIFDIFRHSAFRQYFMPVSISFISLARFRPASLTFSVIRLFSNFSCPFRFRSSLWPVSGPAFLTFSVIRLFGNISCPFRFRSSIWPVSSPASLTFSVIRLLDNISCPFRFRSSLWPVSGPAFLTFSVVGSSAISHARFDTFRNGCSTL